MRAHIQEPLGRYEPRGPGHRPSSLSLECRVQSGVAVVVPLEPVVIGADNVSDLESIIVECMSQGAPVVLDASKIEFFESEGIDGLMYFDRCAADTRVPFVLCGLNTALEQVFRIYGLDCLFKVFPNADAAVRFLTRTTVWH